MHLVHEVTSPQAFEGLELAGRKVRRPDLTLATMDHDVPTIGLDKPIADRWPQQIETLKRNCAEHGVTLHALGSIEQGIVHVIGPQLGLTQPGMTIVCGDSHTSTHGAFGALAFGIGTSEVEHVLATQTLRQTKPGAMAVTVDGELPPGDGQGPGARHHRALGHRRRRRLGHRVPRRGRRALSMEGRMTVCNMSIEGGARAGMIAPDDTTFAYLEGRKFARGAVGSRPWTTGAAWPPTAGPSSTARSASTPPALRPAVTWGTNPAQSVTIDDVVPDPAARCARPSSAGGRAGPGLHGPAGPGTAIRESPWTRCSSARAPTAGSRTCGPPPRWSAAARSARACARSSCPARRG